MLKPKSNHLSSVTRYQNAALSYYLGLTGSPYLHYGYWESLPMSVEEATLVQFRIAQEAYTAKLLSFIPPLVNTVLDVGCGIGGNALYLLERGFKVDGLAPDPFQQEKFLEYTNGQAPFHLTLFEEFEAAKVYDLIFLSESSQYIPAKFIAQSSARVLKPGGYLLIADMMRSDPMYNHGIFSNCHLKDELDTTLSKAGFNLLKSEDISQQVAPTIDLYVDYFRRFGLTTGQYIADVLKIAVPPLYTLLNWIFKRWFEKLLIEGLESRSIFDKHLCYQIQLWQLEKKDE